MKVTEKYFKHDYDSSSSSDNEEESKLSKLKDQMSDVTEKYYIEDDEWDVLPAVLTKPKAGVALCKF